METNKVSVKMSETMLIAAILSISGGLQDVYSYMLRGEVFANAQTGNVVLMIVNLVHGDFHHAVHYLVPLCAFSAGILIAEAVHRRFHLSEKVSWRQVVLIVEAFLLACSAFIPEHSNTAANVLVSFVCAMQVQTFRRFKGKAYASTMCIGNIRSCMESMCTYLCTGDIQILKNTLQYLFVILMFAVGCAFGGIVTAVFGLHSILFSSMLLFIACMLLFIRCGWDDLQQMTYSQISLLQRILTYKHSRLDGCKQ